MVTYTFRDVRFLCNTFCTCLFLLIWIRSFLLSLGIMLIMKQRTIFFLEVIPFRIRLKLKVTAERFWLNYHLCTLKSSVAPHIKITKIYTTDKWIVWPEKITDLICSLIWLWNNANIYCNVDVQHRLDLKGRICFDLNGLLKSKTTMMGPIIIIIHSRP